MRSVSGKHLVVVTPKSWRSYLPGELRSPNLSTAVDSLSDTGGGGDLRFGGPSVHFGGPSVQFKS